jgi:hypothetical protein
MRRFLAVRAVSADGRNHKVHASLGTGLRFQAQIAADDVL